ncbi:protein N-lysine methyltransferase METTL21D-like [Euwallacea fornicatus]|uniref:protein N-lysine methyltransferase METTL21D-like n=1 Tax=Euwallacea fornicatus TaxID=995702 RepID=UPI00338F72DF
MENEYFVREFDIDVLNTSLKLYQKVEGDVGCVVWDASIVLAKYLEELYKKNCQKFKNLNVIELGSGVGCVGLTIACLGSNSLLTDLEEVLPLLKRNIEANRDKIRLNNGSATAVCLNWGETTFQGAPPDLILMADCVYYKESIDKLVDTLKNLSGSNTKVLMSHEIRESQQQQDYWNYFYGLITKHFQAHFVPLEDQNEIFRCSDILVIELTPL